MAFSLIVNAMAVDTIFSMDIDNVPIIYLYFDRCDRRRVAESSATLEAIL